VNKLDAKFPKLTNVRPVYLPPATIAVTHSTEGVAEWTAYEKINEFVAATDLLKFKPDARTFGFNTMNGYEAWVTIPDNMEVTAEGFRQSTFSGGLFLCHSRAFNDLNSDEGELLYDWIDDSEEFVRDEESAHSIFHGIYGHLEEQFKLPMYQFKNSLCNGLLTIDFFHPIREMTEEEIAAKKADKIKSKEAQKMSEVNIMEALTFQEMCENLSTQATKSIQMTTSKIKDVEFIGKVWLDMIKHGHYGGVWQKTLGSCWGDICDVHESCFQESVLFINSSDMEPDLMIGRLKHEDVKDTKGLDVLSVPESEWAIVFKKGSPSGNNNGNIGKLNTKLAGDWLPNSEYEVNTNLPMIEMYPKKIIGLDVHILMKPIFTGERAKRLKKERLEHEKAAQQWRKINELKLTLREINSDMAKNALKNDISQLALEEQIAKLEQIVENAKNSGAKMPNITPVSVWVNGMENHNVSSDGFDATLILFHLQSAMTKAKFTKFTEPDANEKFTFTLEITKMGENTPRIITLPLASFTNTDFRMLRFEPCRGEGENLFVPEKNVNYDIILEIRDNATGQKQFYRPDREYVLIHDAIKSKEKNNE